MNSGQSLFSQLIDHLPSHEFRKCVERYGGNHRVRSFSCWDQFLCMMFAQLTYRESLRDIVACLRSQEHRLYHAGIRGKISRSTLADANESRDWRIYADFAQLLIHEARALYVNDDLGIELTNTVYALDSTTIDLCMTLFPWARFQPTQHAIKLHTLLDLRGQIPTFIRITPAQMHDVNVLDQLTPEPGAFYVIDRGVPRFPASLPLDSAGCILHHTRSQELLLSQTPVASGRQEHRRAVRSNHRADLVLLDPRTSRSSSPYSLLGRRAIQRLIFITNNFTLPAKAIADLYRRRWQVELFFKWIKQHLRIKAFYGTSENAVKTQVWIAVCSYLLVAIARKRLELPVNLYTMLQVLSVSLFERTPIKQAFSLNNPLLEGGDNPNQLRLLDF